VLRDGVLRERLSANAAARVAGFSVAASKRKFVDLITRAVGGS
jgi:hypothetical protein